MEMHRDNIDTVASRILHFSSNIVSNDGGRHKLLGEQETYAAKKIKQKTEWKKKIGIRLKKGHKNRKKVMRHGVELVQ